MFKTKRLTIKRFERIEEVKAFIKMYNNIEERSIHDHIEIKSEKDTIDDFNKTGFLSNHHQNFMILNENNTFIGTIGFTRESDWDVNIGYRLLKKEYRKQGYLTELLPRYVAFIFKNYRDIDRLTLRTAYDNIGSQKVAERSGFTYEGTLRKAYQYRGNRVDFKSYSMLRGEEK